jgi:hypothetical protein
MHRHGLLDAMNVRVALLAGVRLASEANVVGIERVRVVARAAIDRP